MKPNTLTQTHAINFLGAIVSPSDREHDIRFANYVSGLMSDEERRTYESTMSDEERDEAARFTSEADRIVSPAYLREIMGQPTNIAAGIAWDTETDVTGFCTACFGPIAAGLGANKLSRSENLSGPPDLLALDGRLYPVRLSEIETDQGDVLITVETDKALAGCTLHIRGARELTLSLEAERGKAFAMVSLSPDEHAAFCPKAGTKLAYVWQ